MIRISVILNLIFLITISCRQKGNCDQLPKGFTSYEDAIEKITTVNFKIEEDANTSKSSWIRGASFYSCDETKGFFLLIIENHKYLYSEIPYSVWKEFENADSFGKFYNERIRHNYIFYLSK